MHDDDEQGNESYCCLVMVMVVKWRMEKRRGNDW